MYLTELDAELTPFQRCLALKKAGFELTAAEVAALQDGREGAAVLSILPEWAIGIFDELDGQEETGSRRVNVSADSKDITGRGHQRRADARR